MNNASNSGMKNRWNLRDTTHLPQHESAFNNVSGNNISSSYNQSQNFGINDHHPTYTNEQNRSERQLNSTVPPFFRPPVRFPVHQNIPAGSSNYQNMNPCPPQGNSTPQIMRLPIPPGSSSAPQNMRPPIPPGSFTQNMRPTIPPCSSTQNMKLPIPPGSFTQNMRPPIPPDSSTQNMRPPIPPGSSTQNMRPPIPPSSFTQNMRPPIPPGSSTHQSTRLQYSTIPPPNMHQFRFPPDNEQPVYLPQQGMLNRLSSHVSNPSCVITQLLPPISTAANNIQLQKNFTNPSYTCPSGNRDLLLHSEELLQPVAATLSSLNTQNFPKAPYSMPSSLTSSQQNVMPNSRDCHIVDQPTPCESRKEMPFTLPLNRQPSQQLQVSSSNQQTTLQNQFPVVQQSTFSNLFPVVQEPTFPNQFLKMQPPVFPNPFSVVPPAFVHDVAPPCMKPGWEEENKLSKFLEQFHSDKKKDLKSSVKVVQFRATLQYGLSLMKELMACKDNLKLLLKSNEKEWKQEKEKALLYQDHLVKACDFLMLPKNLETVQKKLQLIKKKRKLKKKMKLNLLTNKMQKLKERDMLHQEIDKWLDSIKEKNLKLKREAEMKKEADIILAEVRRKVHEAKRTIEKIKVFEKLRNARQANATQKGLFLPEHDETFKSSIADLKEIIHRQLTDYEGEEKALKVMLEAEHEGQLEEETLWKIKKLKSLQLRRQKNIIECLFGATEEFTERDPIFLFYQFQSSAKKSVESLSQIRHQWDSHINESGESIPHQWIVPAPPTSAIWKVVLDS